MNTVPPLNFSSFSWLLPILWPSTDHACTHWAPAMLRLCCSSDTSELPVKPSEACTCYSRSCSACTCSVPISPLQDLLPSPRPAASVAPHTHSHTTRFDFLPRADHYPEWSHLFIFLVVRLFPLKSKCKDFIHHCTLSARMQDILINDCCRKHRE